MERYGKQITRKLIYCAVHRLEKFTVHWFLYFSYFLISICSSIERQKNCPTLCTISYGFLVFVPSYLDFWYRTPNPDAVVAFHTPTGVFAGRSLLQNQRGCFRGSRLVSAKRTEDSESPSPDTNDFEPLSASRCRVFKRSKNKVMNLGTLYFLKKELLKF